MACQFSLQIKSCVSASRTREPQKVFHAIQTVLKTLNVLCTLNL